MRPLRILPILAVLLAAAPAVRSHELGKIQVYASFLKDGTYRIDVPIDPEHMTPGEAGPAGETRYGAIAGLTPEVDRQFGTFLRNFVDGATVFFNRQPVEPQVAMAPPDPEAPPGRVTLRLHGPIPGGSRIFNWRNTMELGKYPLILKIEGAEEALWQWLVGGATSPPFSLARAAVPPLTVLPHAVAEPPGYARILPED